MSALRFNKDKRELHYPDLFPAALEGVALAYEFGTKRPNNPYPRFNWVKGAPYLELYSCARRHMVAWLNGRDLDEEAAAQGFNLNHLDSAIGNLMRLRQQIADGNGTDDRPNPGYEPDDVGAPDQGSGVTIVEVPRGYAPPAEIPFPVGSLALIDNGGVGYRVEVVGVPDPESRRIRLADGKERVAYLHALGPV